MTAAGRKGILYLCIAIMELCWMYVFLALLNYILFKDSLSITSLFIAYPISFGVGLLLRRFKIHRITLHTISWVLWAIVTLLIIKFLLYRNVPWADSLWLMAVPRALSQIFTVFRPELLILIGTAVQWWFGSRLVRLNMNFRALVFEFQLSLPILLALFALTFILDTDIQSIPTALLFFFFALLGLSISHEQEGNGWLSGIYRSHWSVLLIIAIVIILGLGLLIGLLINENFVQLILDGIRWVWNAIVKAIEWIISLIPIGEEAPPPPPETSTEITSSGQNTDILRIPEQLRKILANGWVIAMLILCIFALWRIAAQIYSWLRKRQPTGEATIETGYGGFKADLLHLLKWLARLFRIKLPQKPKPEQREIVTMRHIYRQLLHWAAAHGLPRKSTQTPDEYFEILVYQFPSVAQELDLITRSYNGARYGHQIPVESELNELKQNLRRIKIVRMTSSIVKPISA